MTYKNFEEYLMCKCMEDEPSFTDDMYPDVYESWIVEQDIDDVIRWADLYGEHKVVEGIDRAIKRLEDNLPNLEEELSN